MSVDINLAHFVFFLNRGPRLWDFWAHETPPVSSAPAAVHKRELPWHILTRAWCGRLMPSNASNSTQGFNKKQGTFIMTYIEVRKTN